MSGYQFPQVEISDDGSKVRAAIDLEGEIRRLASEVIEVVDQGVSAMVIDYLAQNGLLRAAGWRPPARVVTTEEERDALPDLAVIRDSEGTVAELVFGLWYSSDGLIVGLRLPATVLWEPEEGER